jgi:diaminohydroxyphosphoribosylaminopyrimidine deaminase/5-amino-6-(5-phosphoribosylamino)uracil reductase
MILSPGFSFGGLLAAVTGDESELAQQSVEPATMAPASHAGHSDIFWMQQALTSAMTANGRSNPNPSVGCVVVKEGVCIARGATDVYGGPHAERIALDSLEPGDTARGATLYVTLEPCSHFGKQPPCVDRILAAGIARCVIAIADPNPLVDRQGISKLLQHGVEITLGVCQAEAAAWHAPFLNWQRQRQPLLAAKWAQTLDGQLAYDAGEPRWLSNQRSRRYAHWLRQHYDAIMIGAGTALADLPSLTVRDCPPPRDSNPHRILFDPGARTLYCDEPRWQALQTALFSPDATTITVYGEKALAKADHLRVENLRTRSNTHTAVLVIPAGMSDPLPWLLRQLSDPNLLPQHLSTPPIQSILLEGGPRLLSLFFSRGLVAAAHVFITPYLGGGMQHRLTLPAPLTTSLDFQLVSQHAIDSDVLIEYIRRDLATLLMS